jgi:nicotinamidase-related amidase
MRFEMSKLPSFYDETLPILRIVDRQKVYKEAVEFKTNASSKDFKACLFVINNQIGFCNPDSPVYIDGALEDSKKLSEFIYKNVETISKIYVITHSCPVVNINSAAFWVTKTGKPPVIGEIINLEDFVKGKILISDNVYNNIPEKGHKMLKNHVAISMRKIEEEGNKVVIKDFFGIRGSIDNTLMPNVEEAIFFHSCVTGSMPLYDMVGMHPFVYYSSIFTPAMHGEIGKMFSYRKTTRIGTLAKYDHIILSGQSKEVVISSAEDMLENKSNLGKKTIILDQCSSPVGSVPVDAIKGKINALESEGVKFGMEIV